MKKIFLAVLLMIGAYAVSAQAVYNSSGKTNYKKKEVKGFDPSKLVFGGGMSLGIGSGFASLGVSPIVGYRVLSPLVLGVGVGYQYNRFPSTIDQYNEYHYTSMNIIYPNLWAKCFVYRNIYISGTYEYDIIKLKQPLDRYGNFNDTKSNVTNSCLMAGVGMRQTLGDSRVSFYGELFYDLLQGEWSPYLNQLPCMRFGFAVGL